MPAKRHPEALEGIGDGSFAGTHDYRPRQTGRVESLRRTVDPDPAGGLAIVFMTRHQIRGPTMPLAAAPAGRASGCGGHSVVARWRQSQPASEQLLIHP